MLRSSVLYSGILATLFTCSVALLAVWIRRRDYKSVQKALESGKSNRYRAYQHLVTVAVRSMYVVTIFVLLAYFSSSMYVFTQLPQPLDTPALTRLFGAIICIHLGPCLVLPHLLYDLLGSLCIDLPALDYFYSSPLSRSQAFLLNLKCSLLGPLPNEQHIQYGRPVTLLAFLFIEATGLLCYLNQQGWLWTVFVLILCWAAVTMTYGKHIIAWKSYTLPLEQTPWAMLVHHLDSWARDKGVKLNNIQVQYVTRIGVAESIVIGPDAPILLLNSLFLSNSEWRQQEALVAILLGKVKKRITILHTLLENGLFILCWCILIGLIMTIIIQPAPTLMEDIPLIMLIPLLAFVVPTVFTQQLFRRGRLDAEKRAITLTKDPGAVIVALATMHALNTGRRKLSNSLARRIEELEQDLPPDTERLFADRVPAIVQFRLRGQTLTEPLPIEEDFSSQPSLLLPGDPRGYPTI